MIHICLNPEITIWSLFRPYSGVIPIIPWCFFGSCCNSWLWCLFLLLCASIVISVEVAPGVGVSSFSYIEESVSAKSLELWLPRKTLCNSCLSFNAYELQQPGADTRTQNAFLLFFFLTFGYGKMLSYNLPWSPQEHNVSSPGSGWFLFWIWVEEDISAALRKYLPHPLTVQSLVPCSSLSTELLGTLDGIAAHGFFFASFAQFQ